MSPTSVSHVWSVFTSAPWSPCLSVRVNTDPDDVGFTIPVGVLGLTIAAPPEPWGVEAPALAAGASSASDEEDGQPRNATHLSWTVGLECSPPAPCAALARFPSA